MKQIWQLQEAKNKFSQVVHDAIQRGPQIVTKHGIEVAVVLSYAEYRTLVTSQKKLSEFFRDSPLVGIDLDLTRDTSDARTDPEL
jgi:antitoxin Phd